MLLCFCHLLKDCGRHAGEPSRRRRLCFVYNIWKATATSWEKNALRLLNFILVLMTVSGETAGKELIRLGTFKRILDLFFEYQYNNLAHHHIEHIVDSWLESNVSLIQHFLKDCHLVRKIHHD